MTPQEERRLAADLGISPRKRDHKLAQSKQRIQAMESRLSIIIVNWNTKTLLCECITSIYHTLRLHPFEIVVVDNGSNDGSTERVKEMFRDVILIENKSNLGFATANNQGIRLSSGDLVLLLNSDTLVHDEAIDACVAYMDHHPKVGVLGCKVLNQDGSFQSSYFRFGGLLDLFLCQCLGQEYVISLFNKLGFRANTFSRYWGKQFATETEVDVVAGCFFLVRKSATCQVGPLDEDFFFYGEEQEWCFRIRRAGWSVVYYPFAKIVHIHGASSKKLADAGLQSHKARLAVLEKTRGGLSAWLGNLIMSAGAILRIPLWFLAGLPRGGRNAFLSRLEVVRFHFIGLFKPVWRQAANRHER